ncbi:2-amino-4-hydroxy-6-hydroxymethyldihydropteridine diphosphokinase [Frigidibacter sp. MR17.14]|uniref:2-amino-4-hydroxy-6- hydroxymethyldihydropteridine diphosphokinase n=1 Tax=Frigidibacter sp. MR17.14 TaxID=3126509 RepID=UPI003012DEFB
MSQDTTPAECGGIAPIALGANLPGRLGAPEVTLRAALTALARDVGLAAVSRFWRSPAWPPGSGPDYVNAAAVLAPKAAPSAAAARRLLEVLHAVEADLGRVRGQRWGARVIDLDLVGWGGLVLPDAAEQARWRALPPDRQTEETPQDLMLPHPRLAERGFVLLPLAEVAPGWRDPVSGRTVAEMAAALPAAARAGLTPLAA